MKKFKTLLLTSLTAIVLCFCFLFAGCGGTAGTYKFDSMSYAGQTFEVGDQGMDPNGTVIEITEDYFVVTLNEDGTATVSEMGAPEMQGTWKEEGDNVIITMMGNDQTFKKDGKKLTVTMSGIIEITLSK